MKIQWSKSQDIPTPLETDELEVFTLSNQFVLKMTSVATPDTKQSEAYIATAALFFVFGSSAKEEKVSLRLPATWKDLWSELAEAKKNKVDEKDRETVRHLRDMVRKRAEQELEDGVILQGAFKGRAQGKNPTDSDHSDHERTKRQPWGPEYYQNIWLQKCQSPRFHQMLVCSNPKMFCNVAKALSILGCNFQCGSFDNRLSRPWRGSRLSSSAARPDGKFTALLSQ